MQHDVHADCDTPKDRKLVCGRSIRWDDARAETAYAAGWWTHEPLGAALRRAAAEAPDRIVLVDGEREVDCATLLRDALALAGAMLDRGRPGDVVSMMLPNWHEAATIYFAAALAGMVIHPILPALRAHDLSRMLPDAGSRMIFIPGIVRGHDYGAMLREVCAALDDPPDVVVVRGDAAEDAGYAALLRSDRQAELPAADPDAVHMMMYTSGTSGRPKGVLHSQNSLHALIRQLGLHWRIDRDDAFLVPSPVSHVGGSIYAFEMPILLGTRAILLDRWDGATALALMKRHRITHMAGATPFLDSLLHAARAAGEHLPALKLFVCGGAGVSPYLIEAAAAHFAGATVTRVYGATEVPCITVGTLDQTLARHAAHTDGKLGAAEVRLAPSGVAGPGEGEVLARGPQMTIGYHRIADEVDAFDPDGFFRTGDLAYWVDDACLVISGRAKDIIIRHGENISPREVEDLLVRHPAIAEAAVVGIPDAVTGERACAVVVLRPGETLTLPALVAFLKMLGVAAFKLPERLEIWDSLPKNAAGKVLKREIRDRVQIAIFPRPAPPGVAVSPLSFTADGTGR